MSRISFQFYDVDQPLYIWNLRYRNLKYHFFQLGVNTSNFEKVCKDKKVNEALLKELQNHASGKLLSFFLKNKYFRKTGKERNPTENLRRSWALDARFW